MTGLGPPSTVGKRFQRLLEQLAAEHEALEADNRRLAARLAQASAVTEMNTSEANEAEKRNAQGGSKGSVRRSGSPDTFSCYDSEPPSPTPKGRHSANHDQANQGNAFLLWDEWARTDVLGDTKSEVVRSFSSLHKGASMNFPHLGSSDSLRSGDAIQSKGCSRHLVTKPGSRWRVRWDLISMAIISYDCVVIPMQAFELEDNVVTLAMNWLTAVFWSVDMAASFLAGYQIDGMVELRIAKIATKYIRTWFPVDLLLVLLDWVVLFFLGGGSANAIGMVRITKSLRVIRILRMLRLVRLVRLIKVVSLIAEFSDYIRSENMLTIIGILKLLLGLIVVNHFIACGWYSIGILDDGTGTTWVKETERMLEEEPDVVYMYFTSLHWSLTQFTPASMEVVPRNEAERIFNIFVLIFAMVVFSSFVSSITNSVSVMRVRNIERSRQEEQVRRYLTERKISLDLGNRIYSFLRQHRYKVSRRVQEGDVTIFSSLPETLRIQLRVEVFEPALLPHPLFSRLKTVDEPCLTQICHLALSEKIVTADQVLFQPGEAAAAMLIVTDGTLKYFQDAVLDQRPRMERVRASGWVCEAVLWVRWRHRGRLTSITPSEMLCLTAKTFRSLVLDKPCYEGSKAYARRFVDRLMEHMHKGRVRNLSEVQYPGDAVVEKMVEEAFAENLSEMGTDSQDVQTGSHTPTSTFASFVPNARRLSITAVAGAGRRLSLTGIMAGPGALQAAHELQRPPEPPRELQESMPKQEDHGISAPNAGPPSDAPPGDAAPRPCSENQEDHGISAPNAGPPSDAPPGDAAPRPCSENQEEASSADGSDVKQI